MPSEAVVVVSAVVFLFAVFSVTLAWVRWYAGAPRSEVVTTPAE